MLREILLFSFLLGAAVAARSANQYIDNVIQSSLTQELTRWGLNPAALPNFSVRFGPVSRYGNQSQADFYYGNATGFNQVRRKGDCQGPRNFGGEITINCTLSIFPLLTTHQAQIRNGSQPINSVRTEGRVEESLVSLVIAGRPQNYLGTVKSLRIDRLGQVNPSFYPLPAPYSRYVPELQAAYRNKVASDLFGLLQQRYGGAIAGALANKPMPRQ